MSRSLYISISRKRRAASSLFALRTMFIAVIVLLVYSTLIGNAAHGEAIGDTESQSLDAIRAAAETYVRELATAQLGADAKDTIATASELDARLRFARCSGGLKAFVLNNAMLAARTTIGVRCTQGAEWTVYIPVSVQTDMNVLVLRHPGIRAAQISNADVDLQLRRVTGIGANYVTNSTQLGGYRLKRAVPAGVVLTMDMLQRDAIVHRGQQVTLVSNVDGIDVRASGVALGDGGSSDRIRVQNRSSLKIVEGIVESGNLVRVGM